MGDESDAPAYLTAAGVALLLGAVWAIFVSFDGLPKPVAPVGAFALAAALFAIGAAVKASDRHRHNAFAARSVRPDRPAAPQQRLH